MHGFRIFYEILNDTFEISHKILNPYTAKHAFYRLLFVCLIYDIFGLWRQKHYWDGLVEYSSLTVGRVVWNVHGKSVVLISTKHQHPLLRYWGFFGKRLSLDTPPAKLRKVMIEFSMHIQIGKT